MKDTIYLYPSSMQSFDHFFELTGSIKGSSTITSIATHRSKEIYCRIAPGIDLQKQESPTYTVMRKCYGHIIRLPPHPKKKD